MDAFKSNRIIYITQIGILSWCIIAISKYKIVFKNISDIKYVCYAILIYFLYQIIMRLKENEQDNKKVKELDKEINDFINWSNKQR